jgi:hypothetical protein
MSMAVALFGDPVTAKTSKARANLPGGPKNTDYEPP